jgi:transcriptional regulator with XRE-family HTH domain
MSVMKNSVMKNWDPKIIGERLRQRFKAQAITKQEFADGIGLSIDAVNKMFRGLRLDRLARVYRLCELLNVSPNELFGWEDTSRIDVDALQEILEAIIVDCDEKQDYARHVASAVATAYSVVVQSSPSARTPEAIRMVARTAIARAPDQQHLPRPKQ